MALPRTTVLALALFQFLATECCDAQTIFPYREGTQWGYCDSLKRIVIPVQYSSASIFSPIGIATVGKDGKYGFIDTTGKAITAIVFDRWSYLWADMTDVWKDGKVGLVDRQGRMVQPIIFDGIDFVYPGPFALETGELWDLYDRQGKKLTRKPVEDFILRSDLLVGFKERGLWGYMSRSGKVVIKPKFQDVAGFDENGLSAVQLKDKWGFIDRKGKTVMPMQYDETRHFQPEGAWVRVGTKWGLIDSSGSVIIGPRFDDVSYFKEELAFVKLGDKWGYIDRKGATIIPFLYDYAFDFSEGLAEVCSTDSSCGYIDKRGMVVIPLQYQVNFGGEFYKGLAEVRANDRYGFIGKRGEVVVPVRYNSVADYNDFSDGIGELVIPRDGGDEEDEEKDVEARRFYFNRSGTLFYKDAP